MMRAALSEAALVLAVLAIMVLGVMGQQRSAASAPAQAVSDSRAADQAQCRADHGLQATATELPDGSHRCTDASGRRLARSVITIPAHALAQVQP